MRPKLWPVSDHRVTLLGPDGPNFVESGERSLPANRVGGLKTFISGLVILLSWLLYLASVILDPGVTILL